MRLLLRRAKRWRKSRRFSAQQRNAGITLTIDRARRAAVDLSGEIIMQPTGVLETSKATNPLKALLGYGQSMWLDYIRRDLLTSGQLKTMIEEDGLRGMTSNPSIFEKAIADSSLYDDILKSLASRNDFDTTARYEQIAIRDIQGAADILRPVYESSQFKDGYVSLEVSPLLAMKTQETIDEGRRLWKRVNRENVMIKVPGTAEGLPAIRQLISESINVNVTLLFAQEVYEKVAEAYILGLEDLAKRGGNLKKMAGVASFFISRIDTLVDSMIDDKLKTANAAQQTLLKSLKGKVAIANGKLTYQRYQKIFSGPRWEALSSKGAQTQRVLWASTSTKNPAYRDVMYVEELIGPDTVNTMPPATIDAFRDHGRLRNSLTEDVAGAQKVMDDLSKAGISISEVTTKLTNDGVKLFADAFHKLLAVVEKSTQTKGKTA
jgi:transaldolase/glucose-6-phosphate isomerase